MAHLSKNAPLGKGCASQNCSVHLAGEPENYTPSVIRTQAAVFLSRRFGLPASLANTVAELHYGGAA
jgi:hypothetical protein